jgi:hypothetical protein
MAEFPILTRLCWWLERKTRRWRLAGCAEHVLRAEDVYDCKHDAWLAGFNSGRAKAACEVRHELGRRDRAGLPIDAEEIVQELLPPNTRWAIELPALHQNQRWAVSSVPWRRPINERRQDDVAARFREILERSRRKQGPSE